MTERNEGDVNEDSVVVGLQHVVIVGEGGERQKVTVPVYAGKRFPAAGDRMPNKGTIKDVVVYVSLN